MLRYRQASCRRRMRGRTISYCVFNATALIISNENARSCHPYVGTVASEDIASAYAGRCKSKAPHAQISTMQDPGTMLHRTWAINLQDLGPIKMVMFPTNGITTVNSEHNSARMPRQGDTKGETLGNKGSIANKEGSGPTITIILTTDHNNTITNDHITLSMHWNPSNRKIDLLNRR